MKCTFSDPLVLDENGEITQPTDNSQVFVFGSIDCETNEISPDPQDSYFVDISSDSALADGLSAFFYLSFLFQAFIVFAIFYNIGYSFFKRA